MKKAGLFLLLIILLATSGMAQEVYINTDFTSSTIPSGVTSDGSISTTKAADGVCSKGMIQVNAKGYLQIDVPACGQLKVNMKSTASTARTLTLKLKKSGETEYTAITTTLSVSTAASFLLSDLFEEIKSSYAISLRIEPTSGNIQIHDLYVEGASLPSMEAEILGFQLPGQIGAETINSTDATISLQMPQGSALDLIPSFFITSSGASVEPSKESVQNFASPVTYTVKAEDGVTQKVWTVNTVSVKSSEKDITAFKLSDEQLGSASMDVANGIIKLKMPDNVDITNIAPQLLTISSQATITPSATTGRDFTENVTYSVMAQDSTTKVWTIITTVVDPGSYTQIDFNKMVGWASAQGGPASPTSKPASNVVINTTTGGAGGDVRYFTPATFNDLCLLLYQRVNYKYTNNHPLIVVLEPGIYDGSGVLGDATKQFSNNMLTIQEQGDLTIIGKGNVQCKFGINIKRGYNIIIRNIYFWGYNDDAINVGEPETHHVWIDHCTAGAPDQSQTPGNKDAVDGTFEVKNGASYVTVSWCKTQNHWKSCLIGHSDSNGSTDTDRLKVTHYANYFYNTYSRHPRVRFGQVHVLNCMFENAGWGRDNSYKTAASIGLGYGCAASNNSEVLMEGNFFYDVQFPFYADRSTANMAARFGFSDSSTGNKPCKGLKQINNDYDDSGLTLDLKVKKGVLESALNPGGKSIAFDELNPQAVFDPASFYTYDAFTPAQTRELVPQYAGAGILDWDVFRLGITTSMDAPAATPESTVKVYAAASSISIAGITSGTKIAVHNLSGIQRYQGVSSGTEMTLPVSFEKGFYIITVGNKGFKVVVK